MIKTHLIRLNMGNYTKVKSSFHLVVDVFDL